MKFKEARNFCSNKTRDTKKDFEKKIANEAKTDPKSFWRCVKAQTKYNEAIPNLKKTEDTYTETDKDKAEVLNDYFASVFTKDDDHNPNLPGRDFNAPLGDIIMFGSDIGYMPYQSHFKALLA